MKVHTACMPLKGSVAIQVGTWRNFVNKKKGKQKVCVPVLHTASCRSWVNWHALCSP